MSTIDAVVRDLEEKLAAHEALILAGHPPTYEMYCAMVESRSMLRSIIDDIREIRGEDHDEADRDDDDDQDR